MCLRVHMCMGVCVCVCDWVFVLVWYADYSQNVERWCQKYNVICFVRLVAEWTERVAKRERGIQSMRCKGVVNVVRMCVLHGTTWLCISFDMTGAHNDVLRRPKVTFTLFVAAVFHVSDLSMQKIEFHIPCDTTRYDLCSPIVCSLLCGCVLVCMRVCVCCVYSQ